MQLLSICAGQPVDVSFNGKTVSTSIFKKPVSGKVEVKPLGLAGDAQADLSVHGGIDKAVYAYSLDHYDYWKNELDLDVIEPAGFGENLTIKGLDETQQCIGDTLKIGDVLFVISQPRTPCFKLWIKFENPKMVKLFNQAGFPGYYLKVLTPGTIEAGMDVEWQRASHERVSVYDLYRALMGKRNEETDRVYQTALKCPHLAQVIRAHIEAALEA